MASTLVTKKVDTDSDSDDINDIAVTSLFNSNNNNNEILKSEDIKPQNTYFQQTLLMPIHPSAYIQYNNYAQTQGFTTLTVCLHCFFISIPQNRSKK